MLTDKSIKYLQESIDNLNWIIDHMDMDQIEERVKILDMIKELDQLING